MSGPVAASGYDWYEVSPVTFEIERLVEWPKTIVGSSSGWVAVASRDGEAWLGHGEATCPAMPTDVAGLGSLSIGARLACFSRVPITVKARIVPCQCDVDWSLETRPAWFTTSWFEVSPAQEVALGHGELQLAPPGAEAEEPALPAGLDTVWFRLDPEASRPDPLPIGKPVAVTGMFDHPAAMDCESRDYGTDEPPTWMPSEQCRYEFAVTSIK